MFQKKSVDESNKKVIVSERLKKPKNQKHCDKIDTHL